MKKQNPLAAVASIVFLTSFGLYAQPTTVTLVSIADNTLYQDAAGSLSNGSGSGMFAGLTLSPLTRRAVFRFDLSSLPAGALVTAATVQLRCDNTISLPDNYSLHRVSQSWGEGISVAGFGQGGGAASTPNDATWVHRTFPSPSWTTVGGDYSATASATAVVGAIGSYTWASTPGLLADIQSWVANPSSNHGWLLRGMEVVTPSARRFATREDLNPANHPRLIVTYVVPTPSVTSFGLGCSGTSLLPMTLAAFGTPPVPSLGNGTFGLNILNGPPNGVAGLFLAVTATASGLPLSPTCNLYLDFVTFNALLSLGISPIFPLGLSATGSFTLPVPIGNDPGLIGQTIAVQAAAGDPLGPVINAVVSNALQLNF